LDELARDGKKKPGGGTKRETFRQKKEAGRGEADEKA